MYIEKVTNYNISLTADETQAVYRVLYMLDKIKKTLSDEKFIDGTGTARPQLCYEAIDAQRLLLHLFHDYIGDDVNE